jgi:hypothetical protein
MIEKTILLIVGFLFSGVLGGFWGYVLKRRSWAEETRHSLYQARYEEGTRFLDELSELVGRRFFSYSDYGGLLKTRTPTK